MAAVDYYKGSHVLGNLYEYKELTKQEKIDATHTFNERGKGVDAHHTKWRYRVVRADKKVISSISDILFKEVDIANMIEKDI